MGMNVGQTARSLPSYVAVNVSVNHENTCTNIKAIHIKGSDDSLPFNKQRFDGSACNPTLVLAREAPHSVGACYHGTAI